MSDVSLTAKTILSPAITEVVKALGMTDAHLDTYVEDGVEVSRWRNPLMQLICMPHDLGICGGHYLHVLHAKNAEAYITIRYNLGNADHSEIWKVSFGSQASVLLSITLMSASGLTVSQVLMTCGKPDLANALVARMVQIMVWSEMSCALGEATAVPGAPKEVIQALKQLEDYKNQYI